MGIVLISVFAGGMIASTPFHRKIYDQALQQGVPFGGGGLYKRYGEMEFRGGLAGLITSIDDTGFTIISSGGKSFHISTTTKTRYPKNVSLDSGDKVFVIGEVVGDNFEAYGIKVFDATNAPYMLDKRFQNRPDLRQNEIN